MNKNKYLILVLALFSVAIINAQKNIDVGITAGVFYGNLDVSTTGVDISGILTLLGQDEDALDRLDVLDGGGFFIGLVANMKIIEDLSIQPELFYANAGGESILGLPIMIKYYLANSFNIQAGPQFDLVPEVPENAKELFDAFGVSAAVGLGYDFSEKIGIQTKYTFGVTNRLNNDITEVLKAIKPSLITNTLQLGLIYKF